MYPDVVILKSGEFFFAARRKEKKQLYVLYNRKGTLATPRKEKLRLIAKG